MKKAILFITAVIISAALTFGTSSAEEIFNGTAEGHNEPVSVAVKIGDGGVLKQAEVTSHIETKGISDRAITEIPKRILDAQSLQVDVISGATFTSRAVINAVRNAITAAGLDVNNYMKPQPKQEKQSVVYDVDIAIIGGGIAGLSAGTHAAESGKKVLIIEKQSQLGGYALLAAGVMNVAGTSVQRENGVYDAPENNVMALVNPSSKYRTDNPVFTMIMHRHGADMIEELRSRGLEFVEYSPVRSHIHITALAMYQSGDRFVSKLSSVLAPHSSSKVYPRKRFDESLPFTIPARALRAQNGGRGWFVFDDTARAMHKPIEHYFEMGIVTEQTQSRN